MKNILAVVFFTCFYFTSLAQGMPDTVRAAIRTDGLRISLLTCGAGNNEIYETFGHTAIRVTDSSLQPPFNDIVYNYGMFSYGDDFTMKFMRGKLLYYVGVDLFGDFMEAYYQDGRSVEEQELLLTDGKKREIKAYLENNALEENRYYKYDFFFDNCATRLRDVFPRALGKDFRFANVQTGKPGRSFRDIINEYFYRRHWARTGVNILLGSRIDRIMTDEDIMFLPDYLRDGIKGATLNGQPIAADTELLLPGSKPGAAGVNLPLMLSGLLLISVLLGQMFSQLRWLERATSFLLLFVSGLLGCIILVMWFGTDHQGCGNNYNVLWALPLNLMVAFARPKGRGKYAIIAVILIAVSLLLHLTGVQGLTPDLMLFLIALAAAHLSVMRRAKPIPLSPKMSLHETTSDVLP